MCFMFNSPEAGWGGGGVPKLVVDKFILYIVNKHQCNRFTLCSFFFFNFLLLLVLIIQCIVSIGLVTQNLIPNYQLSFFQKNSISLFKSGNLGKPRLWTEKFHKLPHGTICNSKLQVVTFILTKLAKLSYII